MALGMGHEALPADRDDEVDGSAEGIQQTPVLEARLELEVASVAELAVHPHKARRHAALGDGLVDVADRMQREERARPRRGAIPQSRLERGQSAGESLSTSTGQLAVRCASAAWCAKAL